MTDLRAARRPPTWLTAPLVPLVSITAALLEVAATAKILTDCDIGINAAANSWGLQYVLLPILIITNALAFWTIFRVTYAATTRIFTRWVTFCAGTTALTTALAALTLVLWTLLALTVPEHYPTSCRLDPIPWWPTWLPV